MGIVQATYHIALYLVLDVHTFKTVFFLSTLRKNYGDNGQHFNVFS